MGALNAFSPNPGMDFSGYSVYANNIYLDGEGVGGAVEARAVGIGHLRARPEGEVAK